jgi:hypothetical protein
MFRSFVAQFESFRPLNQWPRRPLWAAVAAFLLLVAVPVPRVLAEAIRLEISNFPAWKELEGVRGVPRLGSRTSTLERWDAQSKPYVRITNETESPLVGFRLDLSNWNAKISTCNWLYGSDGTLKWNADLQAAMFELEDALLPGKSLVVRLNTAPKAGVVGQYRMNQTLFSPAAVNCLVCPTGGGVFDMSLNRGDQPFIFDNTGRPVGPGIQTTALDLQQYPIKPTDTITPSGTGETITITPVPEPTALFLAASAAAMFAVAKAVRRRIP